MARITTNLLKYQKTRRQAKKALQINFQNKEIARLAQEYDTYQKEYYRVSKSLRKAGVKLKAGHKQGLWKAGEVFTFDSRGEVMSISEFARYRAKYQDMTAVQIAAKQYNLLDTNLAAELQRNLQEAGLGEYSLDVIRARQLPDDVWKKMELIAYKNDTTVSEYFFGSN